jgi:hypothetical protein
MFAMALGCRRKQGWMNLATAKKSTLPPGALIKVKSITVREDDNENVLARWCGRE